MHPFAGRCSATAATLLLLPLLLLPHAASWDTPAAAERMMVATKPTLSSSTRSKSDDDDVQPRTFSVHNPSGVEVTTIHLVQSAHFDGGCKTFGCSAKLLPGEPDRCAQRHVEPFCYHIVNRWLDEYFLTAVSYANQTRHTSTPYRHLAQPWLLSLFFDCPNAGMLSWPGSGWAANDVPTLHCPNASTIAEVKGALQRGDIVFHAFPFDAEASAYPNAGLFDAALGVARTLSSQLGLPVVRSVSMRDVPGWTRATIPLLHRAGTVPVSQICRPCS